MHIFGFGFSPRSHFSSIRTKVTGELRRKSQKQKFRTLAVDVVLWPNWVNSPAELSRVASGFGDVWDPPIGSDIFDDRPHSEGTSGLREGKCR